MSLLLFPTNCWTTVKLPMMCDNLCVVTIMYQSVADWMRGGHVGHVSLITKVMFGSGLINTKPVNFVNVILRDKLESESVRIASMGNGRTKVLICTEIQQFSFQWNAKWRPFRIGLNMFLDKLRTDIKSADFDTSEQTFVMSTFLSQCKQIMAPTWP